MWGLSWELMHGVLMAYLILALLCVCVQLSADRLAAAIAEVKAANDPASIKSYNTIVPGSNCGWHEHQARHGHKHTSSSRGRPSVRATTPTLMALAADASALPPEVPAGRTRSGRPSIVSHAAHAAMSSASGTLPHGPSRLAGTSGSAQAAPAGGVSDASASAPALPRHMQALREEASSSGNASSSRGQVSRNVPTFGATATYAVYNIHRPHTLCPLLPSA